jgi:hypothetical protein
MKCFEHKTTAAAPSVICEQSLTLSGVAMGRSMSLVVQARSNVSPSSRFRANGFSAIFHGGSFRPNKSSPASQS